MSQIGVRAGRSPRHACRKVEFRGGIGAGLYLRAVAGETRGAGGLVEGRAACDGGVRVSWIFTACLLGYLSLRVALWLRGQVRLAAVKDRLPAPPRGWSRPVDVSPGLALLLERNFVGRVALVESVRAIAVVLITDPDAPLGFVRDFRYRVAVARAWSAACVWLEQLAGVVEDDRVRLEGVGYTDGGFRDLHAGLHRVVRTTVRARALEAFPVDEVAATQARLTAMVEELERLELALSRGAEDPYR